MANLNQTIQSLAQQFASELVVAVRGMSLDEILGFAGAKAAPSPTRPAKVKATPGKRGRPVKITVDAIVAVLKQHKDGMRSRDLRAAVARNVTKEVWRGTIKRAIAAEKVRMTGTKNTAVYFVT